MLYLDVKFTIALYLIVLTYGLFNAITIKWQKKIIKRKSNALGFQRKSN